MHTNNYQYLLLTTEIEKEEQLKREREEWQQQHENLSRERERLERELEHERERRQTAEQRARNLESHHEEQVNQLTRTLTTAQQELEHEKEQSQTTEQQVREAQNLLQVQQHQVSDLTVTVTRTQGALEHEREQMQRMEQHSRDLEGRLQVHVLRVNELTTTLVTTQEALEECRSQSRDWVISRDEVRMSDMCLGKGGWGAVVKGTFRGTKVAVKQIHELIVSPHNQRLFEREMNMASRCRHPCLLQFIGATNDDTSPLFVTELMETSLRAVLHERSLTSREILVISTDVARALNYLHLNRPTPIIHRDISSANVLLWRQGETWRGKVSDYGTANFVRQEMTAAPGAPPYSAPEALTSTQSPKVGFPVCFG